VISLGSLVAFGVDSGNWLFGTSLILCILAIAVGPIVPILNSPLFKTFGELTYSVFLWHVPIQICLRWILIETGRGNQSFSSPLLLGGYLFATYLVGYLSFRYVEEPTRRMIRSAT
jgi:peptidoglycan/LPS O-acetylase OafA/YrhL